MPFTPAHILAVTPLWPWRRWLPFNALVVGSMVPDLPHFWPLVSYHYAHSWHGLVLFCLPVGVVFYLLFEWVLRPALVALLPAWFEHRIPASYFRLVQPTHEKTCLLLISIIAAVLLGACTHIVWDAFTHKGRWGVNLLPALNASISVGQFSLPGYKIFQYGSTLLGLPVLMLLWVFYLSRKPVVQAPGTRVSHRWKLSVLGVFASVPILVAAVTSLSSDSLYAVIGRTIKLSGGVLLGLLIVYSVGFLIYTNQRNEKAKS